MAGRWACEACGSPWAPGAPCCPRCRSTTHIEDAEAPDVTLKTNRQGVVTDSADVAALEEKLARDEAQIAELEAAEEREHPGTGEEMHGIEAPADGTMSPPVSDDPPAPVAPRPPRVPPRRTPPPGADGG